MDLSKFLPNLNRSDDDLSPEDLEAARLEAIAERKTFHRDHVRNGPIKPGWIPAGRQRRALARDVSSRTRKQNAGFRRDWMANQRSIAVLRGQLITVGAIPAASDRGFTPAQVRNAEIGLLGGHGHETPWKASRVELDDAVNKGRALYFDIVAEQAAKA